MVSLVKGRKMRREGAPPLLCAQLRDSLSLLKTVRAHKATTPLLTLANSARLPLTHGIVLLCQLSRCWALLAPCNLSTSTHLVLPTAYHGIYWPAAFWSSDEADVLASYIFARLHA